MLLFFQLYLHYTSHSLTEHNYTIPIAVPGADEDAKRIAKLVNDKGDCFDEVIVTLDSHYMIHIAHGHLFNFTSYYNSISFLLTRL